jgi:hypothetical protein
MRVPRKRKQRAAPGRVIDGAAVVIQTRLSEVALLNEVGTLVWTSIDGTRSERDLVSLVTETFDVTDERATRDVARFLDELAAASLVEFAP